MIRAGVGVSTEEDTERAAQEATAAALDRAGLDSADWAVVFATPAHRPGYSRMLGAVSSTAETPDVVGCCGVGVIASDREIEGGPGVSVLVVSSDTLTACPFLVREADDWSTVASSTRPATRGRAGAGGSAAPGSAGSGSKNSGTAGRGSADSGSIGPRRSSDHPDDSSLLVLLPDPAFGRLDLVLGRVLASFGEIPVVGGAPSEDGSLGSTFEFSGEKVAAGGISGLRLGGAFSYTIGITQAHQPLGEACIVTRAAGSVLHEVDGRPALTVLLEQLPKPLLQDLGRAIRYVAVGIAPAVGVPMRRGEYLVRDILGIDAARGTIRIAGRASAGQSIYFTLLEAERARADLKQMLEALASGTSRRRFRFGLYFDCAARGSSLYRMAGVESGFLGSLLPGVPIAGFFGNAEIAPLHGCNHILTYSGVLALISDPD